MRAEQKNKNSKANVFASQNQYISLRTQNRRIAATAPPPESQCVIAELETAKSACLEIMLPVVMSAEKLGKENNLLQDKISALELELSNAKAENLPLQGRVNEFY